MYYIYYSTDLRYMYCIIFQFSPVIHRIDYVFVCYKKFFCNNNNNINNASKATNCSILDMVLRAYPAMLFPP